MDGPIFKKVVSSPPDIYVEEASGVTVVLGQDVAGNHFEDPGIVDEANNPKDINGTKEFNTCCANMPWVL